MKDGNMMPVWFEADCLPNILINDGDLPNNEESDNDDYEDDETATDKTDDSGDGYYIWYCDCTRYRLMDVTYVKAWS